MVFFGNWGRAGTNVTGVDTSGHERTPADIFCGKKCLTGFGKIKEPTLTGETKADTIAYHQLLLQALRAFRRRYFFAGSFGGSRVLVSPLARGVYRAAEGSD